MHVGNLGQVFEGPNEIKAREAFKEYKGQSESDYGRAAGESVTLMRDGEPIQEHIGKQEV